MIREWVQRPWYGLVQMAGLCLGWALWYQDPSRAWPLIIAALPLLVRWGFERPRLAGWAWASLAIFMVTAGVGVWTAYDPHGQAAVFPAPVGWQKLWGLGLAAILFLVVATASSRAQLRWMGFALTGLGALVAIWFLLTNNWLGHPAEFGMITRLGRALQAGLPFLAGHRLNANVAAGIMVPLFPLALGMLGEGRRREVDIRWAWWGLLPAGLMALGLLFTTSRGALMALIGGIGLALLWWIIGRWVAGWRRVAMVGVIVAVSGLALMGVVLGLPVLRERVLSSGSLANRLGIYSQGLLLIRDYPYTGSGLGEFALVHSTYSLLIHVPILAHAHALPLNLAIEQGVPGLVAALGLFLGAGWWGLRGLAESGQADPLLGAGMLGLLMVLGHGLVDDPLYSSRGVVLLWLPVALILAVESRPSATLGQLGRRWSWAFMASVGVGLLVAVLAWRSLWAAWQANLGAVRQTRVELAAYDYKHFDDPTLDQIRQQVDLSRAESAYKQALAHDPTQVTALTRLSAITFSRGVYSQALAHAQRAWEAGYQDRVTRLVLGDALVANGALAQGAEIVEDVEWAESRLLGQAWYKYWSHADYRRAADAWRVVMRVNPEEQDRTYWIQRAEKAAAES